MQEFEISASDDIKEHTFRLKALGNQWYEIFNEENEMVGEIRIDQENHQHCETKGCTLDLPILNSIRKNIFLHKVFAED